MGARVTANWVSSNIQTGWSSKEKLIQKRTCVSCGKKENAKTGRERPWGSREVKETTFIRTGK